MAAEVRLTRFTSTALHIVEMAESTAIETIERSNNALVESLVVRDKY